METADGLAHLNAGHAGHDDVGENDVEAPDVVGDLPKPFDTVRGEDSR